MFNRHSTPAILHAFEPHQPMPSTHRIYPLHSHRTRCRATLLRAFAAACLIMVAMFATACGGDESLTSEELFAPSEDVLDLKAKPPVADEYLVPVDELAVTDLIVGDGEQATSGTVVSMQYVGVLASDGSEFDASWNRGAEPLVFALDVGQVIPGWDEGIQGMRVGGRRVLQIPAAQAYGENSPSPDIPADSDLVFIVDLVEVQPPPPSPTPTPIPEPAPPIPEDALGEFDELGIIDLVEGSGRRIEVGDIITVNYVGVGALDGVEFDSSWSRSQAFSFIAGRGAVIEGWREGMIGAQAGTQRILQIPSAMAYDEGDLVFRVHVEEVVEAPLGHTLTFGGALPGAVNVQTLVEGSGDGVESGQLLNAQVVVMRYSDSEILQSSYETDTVAPMYVSDEGMLPGLNDGVIGLKVGEIRQIIVPVNVAYPDGLVPSSIGAGPGDSLVFIIEGIEITDP